jgi:menaquinol-cytochrome c reductase iron-sulfur subunit
MPDPKPSQEQRRSFFKQSLSIVIGTLVTLVPMGAGLAVFMDPLRRKATSRGFVRIATIDAVPADGIPRKFPVLANRTDAWNKFTEVPIGAVYIRRTTDNKLQVFNVVCPHAGCFVNYLAERGSFLCPCHQSSFTVEGKIDNPDSPSPRALDSLAVELRGKDVWVQFQNFQAGHAEKIPVA